MNYNLKVTMERHGSNIVTQIEVAGIGRAGRKVLTSPDFDTALKDLKAVHDEIVGAVLDYHKPVQNTTQEDLDHSQGKRAKKSKAAPKSKKGGRRREIAKDNAKAK